MQHLELRPDNGVRTVTARFPEVVFMARVARVGGFVLIAVGSVLNAVGIVCFGVFAVVNLLCMVLDFGGNTEFEAGVVLLYSVVPGVAMVALGSLYAGRTTRERLWLGGVGMMASFVVGPHLIGAVMWVLWAVMGG